MEAQVAELGAAVQALSQQLAQSEAARQELAAQVARQVVVHQ